MMQVPFPNAPMAYNAVSAATNELADRAAVTRALATAEAYLAERESVAEGAANGLAAAEANMHKAFAEEQEALRGGDHNTAHTAHRRGWKLEEHARTMRSRLASVDHARAAVAYWRDALAKLPPSIPEPLDVDMATATFSDLQACCDNAQARVEGLRAAAEKLRPVDHGAGVIEGRTKNRDTYFRGGHLWTRQWSTYTPTPEQLAEIEADAAAHVDSAIATAITVYQRQPTPDEIAAAPPLELRPVNRRLPAERFHAAVQAASAELDRAEKYLAAMSVKAEAMRAEAEAAAAALEASDTSGAKQNPKKGKSS